MLTRQDLIDDLTALLKSRNAVHGIVMDERTIRDYVAHLAQPSVIFCEEQAEVAA